MAYESNYLADRRVAIPLFCLASITPLCNCEEGLFKMELFLCRVEREDLFYVHGTKCSFLGLKNLKRLTERKIRHY